MPVAPFANMFRIEQNNRLSVSSPAPSSHSSVLDLSRKQVSVSSPDPRSQVMEPRDEKKNTDPDWLFTGVSSVPITATNHGSEITMIELAS